MAHLSTNLVAGSAAEIEAASRRGSSGPPVRWVAWRVVSCAILFALAPTGCGGGGRASGPVGAVSSPSIFTVAGTGGDNKFSGDGGLATEARLSHPEDVAVLPGGGFLIGDADNERVRRVSKDGIITTVAGGGARGPRGDGGPATKARLSDPEGVAVLPDGGFLIADTGDQRVRRVFRNGTITTVAGTGARGFSGDGGPAIAARLDHPSSVAVLRDGGFLIADWFNHRVRRVTAAGIISTVAGTGSGFGEEAGDGGLATAAAVDPVGVAALPDGGFLIADEENSRVRRVAPDATISTVAGTGVGGFSGDGGPATAAQIANPGKVAVTPDGGFVIADSGNGRVRQVAPDGTITTVAGPGPKVAFEGAFAFVGDGGPATAAHLDQPGAVAALGGGFLIADSEDQRVRWVEGPGSHVLALAISQSVVGSAGRYSSLLTVSRPSALAVDLLLGGHRVARGRFIAPHAGRKRVTIGYRFSPGLYTVRVLASSPDRRRALQTALVVLGSVLPTRWARNLSDFDQPAPDTETDVDEEYATAGCHRFGTRRVDCEERVSVDYGAYRCAYVSMVELGSNGQLYARSYACPTRGHPALFKLHPRWLETPALVDLASLL
jgi:NHL repeat